MYADLLAKVELLRGLDRVTLAELAAQLEPQAFRDGARVCAQGEAGDALYIVARGAFGVFASSADRPGETRIGRLVAGDHFGEMALLTDEPRSATVRAEGDSLVLRLERGQFLRLLQREPSLARAVAAVLSRRLRERDRASLQNERALAQVLAQGLERLDPERRGRVLRASVLDDVSPEIVRVAFPDDADAIVADLAELGLPADGAAAPALRALRSHLEREVDEDDIRALAVDAAHRLAAAGRWPLALQLVARYGSRADFIGALRRALRAVPALGPSELRQWVERVDDDEAAADPELALAKAEAHEERGDAAAAAALLRRAGGQALLRGDAEAARRLVPEVARLGSTRVGRSALPLAVGFPRLGLPRPRLATALATLAAAALTATGLASSPTSPQLSFALLLAAAVALWVTESYPEGAVGLALLASWVFAGIADPARAAGGFATSNWLFVLGVLGIAAGVARSGLLLRAGLLLVRRLPARLLWQAAALLLTGLVLSPLLPQNKGRVALVAPLALAVAQASRLKDREPAAAILGLATWVGASPLMFVFLNGSSLCLLAWGLLPDASRARFDWITWFLAAAPLGIFLAATSLAALFLLHRAGPSTLPGRERVELQLAVLGAPTARELRTLAILIGTVAGWVAAPALGVDVGAVALFALLALVVVGDLGRRSFQELDWNYLIFYGVAVSAAELATSLGVDRAVAGPIGRALDVLGAETLPFVLAVGVASLVVQLVLPKNTALLLLALTVIPVASARGVEPWVVAVTLLATSSMWFIPSQTTSYLIAYGAVEGRLYSHGQARVFAAAYAILTFVGLALSLPYWRAIGVL